MFRLLTHLLGKPFEECKSCETLKQQLEYERAEKIRLTDTLLGILQPKAVPAAPVEINPIHQTSGLFSRRRAALEARDRESAKILAEKKYVAVPDKSEAIEYRITQVKQNIEAPSDDAVEKLERELGLDEKEA
jgi:uncharacterized protein YdcH (DUF465 family)